MKKKIKIKKNNFKTEVAKSFKQENELEKASMKFLSYGIACQAICLIEHASILKILLNKGKFRENQIKNFKNPSLIKTAFISLIGAKIISYKDNNYFLTKFGKYIAKKIGFITIPFVGYRKLISKQSELLDNPESFKFSDIDFPAIALSSIDFGVDNLDPLLIKIFKVIKPRGTICDLGCGTGEKLVKICQVTNSPGLGIEQSKGVIKESQKFIKNYPEIEIVKGSITALKGVWEDVTVALISFVCHDIKSKNKCSKILYSYQKHFPRMKCLIVVDIVSLSKKVPTIMPGFDYVHGLQGLTPRTYEETIETFEKARYDVLQEISVPNMSNTFIWILKPNDL
ncbi:MAG: hypothetical protein K1060chlam4_00637 [Candidatus Anoxychlamydiales bacterium]|nr:hypothetical protein [Candidatus Anoxychlamydiales bacterium]